MAQLGLENCSNLVEDIAQKITEHSKKASEQSKNADNIESSEIWHETETEKICIACVKFCNSSSVPQSLKKFNKGKLGFLLKPDGEKPATDKDRQNRIRDHLMSPLHLWCTDHARIQAESAKEFKDQNNEAGEKVVTNALYCFKTSGSAQDFVRLNDKDQLTNSKFATKNDGKEIFFELRDIVFEKLGNLIKEKFKKIKNASFSLDKVTVSGVPYTVLVTYFFWEGKIHAVLNSLHVMKSFEYSGVNTARMIGMDLMSTLGLSRQQIGEVFNHAVYDGVYAPSSERVRGGGSLSLMHHFAEWCGLSEDDFTGHWDMGHLMQLVYGESLLHDEEFKKFNKTIYHFMASNKCGQAGLRFKELADDFKNAVLENKSPQVTRWVRAQLRGNQAFFRNLPTLYQIIDAEVKHFKKTGNTAKQLEAEAELTSLSDPENIAFGIGISQILESYAAVSLDVQNLSHFPTSVESSIRLLRSVLERWSFKWEWKTENLNLSGIGNPSDLIENLEHGFYIPYLTSNAKQAAATRLNITRRENLRIENSLKENSENLQDLEEGLFMSETSDVDLGEIGIGEVPIVGFDNSMKNSVERKLEKLCLNLASNFEKRLKIPKIFSASTKAFETYKTQWFSTENITEEQTEKNETLLGNIIEEVKGPYSEYFQETIESCLIGYEMFLRHSLSESAAAASNGLSVPSLESVYERFCRNFAIEETKVFRQLFEFVQLKTYSEAICETIGSIMNIAQGKCRNIHPINFSKEIFLRYNLPPLHILKKKIIPEIVNFLAGEKGKEFIRRGDGFDRQKRKFTYHATSASLGNFRKNEETVSHLPVSMF